jgi:hypothetical protein
MNGHGVPKEKGTMKRSRFLGEQIAYALPLKQEDSAYRNGVET